MKTIRVSSLPRIFKCAASLAPVKISINGSNPAAADGTAAHEVLQGLPSSGIQWDKIPAIAAKHGANPDEVRMLSAMGAKLWNQVKDSFLGAMTEVRLEIPITDEFQLVGHADLIAVSSRAIRVGDYKTGRKDSDYHHQLVGYAALALLASEDIDEASATILWVREQEIENWTLDRAAAEAWLKELRWILAGRDTFRPGSHCAYCPRNHECEAANALVRRDIAAITDKSLAARLECDLATMPHEEVIAALHKADLVVKYAERVRAAVKAHIEAHGDIIAPGARLTVVSEERRELDPLAAWPILEQLDFKDEDLARVMKLSISKIEQVLRDRAPKGEKKRAVEHLGELLQASNAVIKTKTSKLQERRS